MLLARTALRSRDGALASAADGERAPREAGHLQGFRWFIPLDPSSELG